MSKIDVISQICVYVDYPLYREFLKKYRDKFNKIILYPSRHHGVVDLEDYLKETIPETWVKPVEIDYGKEDWRQAETMPCLEYSGAEWILFLEQDFFCDDWDKLWEDVEKAMQEADLIGWWNETHFPYVHPCFLLIKRELLDKTNKDFSAHPEINGGDHFAMITHDAQELGATIVKLQDLGWTEPEHAMHLGGLTYPYQNFDGDNTIIGCKYPDAFYTYNAIINPEDFYSIFTNIFTIDSLAHTEFIRLMFRLKEVMDKKGINYDPKWEKFFKL